MTSYHRYSHYARRALTHAGVLALRCRHPYVNTEHVLVGVMYTFGSIGCKILAELELTADRAESHLCALLPSSEQPTEAISNHPMLNNALHLAADECDWLGHHYIGTEHLLLGITRDNVGQAHQLLYQLNVWPEKVRRHLSRALVDGVSEFDLEYLKRNARFSELARRVINAAEQIAHNLEHPTVGLGHLLQALIAERRGMATKVFRESGFLIDQLNVDVQQQYTPLMIGIEETINQALDLAEQHSSHYTGTEHFILTLLTENADLFQRYGVNSTQLGDQIQQALGNQR
ncbi:MAG: hypothetical protein MUF87_03455 [Anaerolineae bacterium]|jgi:ATP-dependent Clp protease ATP-binding subunit ClpA|nr:hypothetical protein [Anaerolineae bacterium]